MADGATESGAAILGALRPEYRTRVLTPDALAFLADLHRQFAARRDGLLTARAARAAAIRAGELPEFPADTAELRRTEWTVGETPEDLRDRRVEITGPAEAKMMINALNSGARAFMCDLEDSLSPTWSNVMDGQLHLQDAVRRTLTHTGPDGRAYRLKERTATLLVRPRGWHLPERHLQFGGRPAVGALVDFGLHFYHNARALLAAGSGPYFYLPKLEGRHEARLWNDVFDHAQDRLGLPRGTIKCTVLIETILAAYEMDEILWELRPHITGLNAGRWDYIFSVIKKFAHDPARILPDRAQVTMAVPFMRAYCDLLVRTCHRRDAHAMGGMSAFIPSRRDPEVNRVALAKVTEDKEREAGQGFDGTWIAHPDLVAVATPVFDRALAGRDNQKHVMRPDVRVTATELIDVGIAGGRVSEAGIAANINVAAQYLDHWLRGTGAVALHNLMEDAATAEIARAQLWQWLRHGAKVAEGGVCTRERYQRLRDAELARLGGDQPGRLREAMALLDELVLAGEFAEFLTLPAYERLKD